MARRDPLQGGLVPVAGPDGSIQWQTWEYGELLRHLNSDLDLTGNDSLPTVAQYAPGYEWAYQQITAAVTVTSTVEASGTLVMTAPTFTPDGAPLLCHFHAPYVEAAAVASSAIYISLFEGATEIGIFGISEINFGTGGPPVMPFDGFVRFSPSAGPHTYKITAFEAGGTAFVGAGGGNTGNYLPAFVRFTKV